MTEKNRELVKLIRGGNEGAGEEPESRVTFVFAIGLPAPPSITAAGRFGFLLLRLLFYKSVEDSVTGIGVDRHNFLSVTNDNKIQVRVAGCESTGAVGVYGVGTWSIHRHNLATNTYGFRGIEVSCSVEGNETCTSDWGEGVDRGGDRASGGEPIKT